MNRESDALQVFIPEVIPLENKGEEAILRGLQDVIFPQKKVHFHFLAYNVKAAETRDNLTIYPNSWFYPRWVFREVYVSANPLDIVNFGGYLFQGFRNRFSPLAQRGHGSLVFNALLYRSDILRRCFPRRAEAVARLFDADFVLAGHDNAMGLREAHLLLRLRSAGVPYGVFGCGMNSQFANSAVKSVYQKAFSAARFLHFRDELTWRGIVENGEMRDAQLTPDPAFGMAAASPLSVEEYFRREGLDGFFEKPVVALTVVENAVIAQSFTALGRPAEKARAHYRIIGALVDHLVNALGVNVLFLPHCIGPTARLDDRNVARKCLAQCSCRRDSVRILENPTDARMLKGIIARSAMLIGERTHSIIGAVGVGTPFICLGSSVDKRTSEIVGKMCECSDLVYDLRTPDIGTLKLHVAKVWQSRAEYGARIMRVGKRIAARLGDAGSEAARSICDSLRTARR